MHGMMGKCTPALLCLEQTNQIDVEVSIVILLTTTACATQLFFSVHCCFPQRLRHLRAVAVLLLLVLLGPLDLRVQVVL